MAPLPENETAIADLRRQVRRANTWRYVFLFMMPVGFIVPCAIGLVLGKSNPHPEGFTAAHAFGIAAFALPLVGLAGWILMAGDRAKYRTSLAVAGQADSLGYRFSARPPDKLMKQLGSFRMFEDADHQFGLDCVSGKCQGQRFALLEYRTGYTTGPHPYGSKVNNQTVVVLSGLDEHVPDFRIGPKTWLAKLLQFFDAKVVKLPGPQEATRKLIVCGEDRDRIVQVLTPPIVELVLEARGTVEVRDGSLLFYRHNRLEDPEDYQEMLELAIQLAKALR